MYLILIHILKVCFELKISSSNYILILYQHTFLKKYNMALHKNKIYLFVIVNDPSTMILYTYKIYTKIKDVLVKYNYN